MRKMVVDTHIHTIASGHAYSTLIENCAEAGEKGMKLIAITDHGPAMPGGPHAIYFANQKVIPRVVHGVEVLRGLEANIIDFEGNIDMEEKRLHGLELVIASLHEICIKPGSVREHTNALIGAMKNKYVDIIGHPGNPAFSIDIDEVLDAALEYNVLIEINNSSLGVSRPGSKDVCKVIARKAAEKGNRIALGSDAHICYSIGEFKEAEEIIKAAGIKDENVINIHEDRLKEFLRSKGKQLDI
jgi:putative hydrolase